MTTTTTPASPAAQDWREGRRLRAWALKQAGWSQRAIATALGVSERAVCHWIRRARAGGAEALRRHPAPGAKPKLSTEQRAELLTLLARGAEPSGFLGNAWTAPRVATLLRRQFGVASHPAQLSRLLRQLGWSVQRPITRATQRDAAAIAGWWRERWPAPKTGGHRGPHARLGR